MRHDAPHPAANRLPLPPARDQHRRHQAGPLDLPPADITAFNDLLHELHPDAPHVDADAVASVARWLLALPEDEGRALLQARLRRLADLEEMAADPDWALEPALARRLRRLLDYVARGRQLIPDDIPRVGQLDDALLVELAWPFVAEELEDYRDFCRYRAEVAAEGGQPSVEAWLRTRLEEGALWEQLHRVRHQPYVDYGPLEGGLRVV